MESLSRGVLVKSCVVYYSSWGSIVFSCNDHAAAPRDRIINSYFLQDAQADISVQSIFNWLLPVKRDLARGVDGCWTSLFIYKYSQWWGAVHQPKRLMLTRIEGTSFIMVQNKLTKFRSILCCWGEWQDIGNLWRKLSTRTFTRF